MFGKNDYVGHKSWEVCTIKLTIQTDKLALSWICWGTLIIYDWKVSIKNVHWVQKENLQLAIAKKNELGGLLFYECEFRTKQAKNIFGQEHISPFQAVLATACAGSAGICLYDYFFLSPYVWHHIGVSGLQGFHRFFSQQVGGPKKLWISLQQQIK